jgi:hypothetical protein
MKYFSLVLLVVLAASPLSTTANVICIGVGTYTANSTYEANLRRLASILPAEISSSPQAQGLHALGYWPNRLRATWTCFGGSSSSCSACIAAGFHFQESEGECPYSKEFSFSDGDCCELHVADFLAFEHFFRESCHGIILQKIIFDFEID